jgi:hypothetical protein
VRVRAVVARDPFAPDRQAPLERYRLPQDAEADAELMAAEGEAPAQPRVLGTVVATQGRSFAVCQLPDAAPTVVHVGDRLGDYTVQSISRGRVTFTTAAGGRVVVDAPSPPR